MKKYVLHTLLLVCAFVPVTAQSYVLTSVAEQGSTYLESEKNVYFGTDASERLVEVNTNIDFTVVTDADWCKVEKKDKAVKLTLEANVAVADRTATVTLKGKDALSWTMEVCQYGTDAEKYPTFAVISDLHFGNTKGEGPMVKVPRALKQLTAKGKLDAIVVVGDITDGGQGSQYDQLVQVFTDEDNFINPVDTLLFMMGNHDHYNNNGGNYPIKMRPFNNGNNYPYDQYLVIKGYPFIVISIRGSSNYDSDPVSDASTYPQEVRDKLEAWLEKAATECPGKPIFVFNHVPPKYTCYSTWPGEGYGSGSLWGMSTLNPILNKYPQVVAFGGHSHYPLGDPRSIHQGVDPNGAEQNYFTGVGTGSITYSEIHSPAVDWSDKIHPNYYEHITEGLIVDVKPEGNVEIRRYDTRLDEEIQPDNRWNLEPPFDGSKFAYADKRDQYINPLNKPFRDGLPAPVFDAGAKVNITHSGASVTATFPQATDNDCVFRYKVTVVNDKGFAVCNNWLFSEFYRNSDTPETLTVTFTGLELGAEYTVVVEAYDSYDNVSEKLKSETYIQGGSGDSEVPARLALWTFDTPNDTIFADEGDIELRPGKILNETFINKKVLSKVDTMMVYTEGPTEDNGALFVPKGASFNMRNPKKLTSYTLMFDVKIPDHKFRALLQTNQLHNDDADFFINASGGVGLGVNELGYGGQMELNKWHRIVISTKEGRPSIYLDGCKVREATAPLDRWIIGKNRGYFFADDSGETADIYVAEIGLWDVALTEGEVLKLGYYKYPKTYSMTVSGTSFDLTEKDEFTVDISATIEPKFTFPEWIYLKRPMPSIGSFTYHFGVLAMPEGVAERKGELIVSAPEGSGIAPVTISLTQASIDTELPEAAGVWTFDNADDWYAGSADDIKLIPYLVGANNTAPTAFAAGAATGVTKTAEGIALPKSTCLFMDLNEESDLRSYTIAFDMKASNVTNYISFYQTNLSNNDDGDLFISEGRVGRSAGNLGYGGSVRANTWHRVVVSVRDGIISTYIDGEYVGTSKNTNNDCWCLNKKGVYLFCDNDGEHNNVEVAGIQFWKESLGKYQVATLGKFE